MSKLQNLLKGIIKENPVLVLVLGTCPTLAVSTSVINALGMGIAATAVLICSNMAISAFRKIIPDKVRIPCYIVLIAGFVTMIEMLMHAFVPDLYEALGVFLSLIVVNCIILGRAEMYASKNGVLDSAIDAVGMGIGFTLALLHGGVIKYSI
jgi:electron transport complex protein RnfE